MTIRAIQRFSFFQLVQLLERFYGSKTRVGLRGPAEEEIIRFRPDDSLAFPASDVSQLEPTRVQPPRYRLTTTFLGLYGSVSPLPSFYAEEILRYAADPNPVREFLDVFHHRLLSFFYRAWLKYRYHFQFSSTADDPFTTAFFSLMGLRMPDLLESTHLPNIRLLRYAGLLHQRPRSACALRGIISEFFGKLPVYIEQCTGRWVRIKDEQRSTLAGQNCTLGRNCAIGDRAYSYNVSFRIVLGPLQFGRFLQFLPVEENFAMLVFLVQLFLVDRLDFDLQLLVIESQIPSSQLKSDQGDNIRPRLGWSSWLVTSRTANAAGEERTRYVIFPGRLRRSR